MNNLEITKDESLVKTKIEDKKDNIEFTASGAVVEKPLPDEIKPKSKNVRVRRNILLPTSPKKITFNKKT